MKYLCLAYGSEEDWKKLPEREQKEVLAHDDFLKGRGDTLAAVETTVTTVTAWDGTPTIVSGSYAKSNAPLAGFSIMEAADINEAIQLVTNSPCARAKGAVEIRPLLQNADD